MSGQDGKRDPVVSVGVTIAFWCLTVTAAQAVLLSAFLFAASMNEAKPISKDIFWHLLAVGSITTFGAAYLRHVAKSPGPEEPTGTL
jgi:hypothetical protein